MLRVAATLLFGALKRSGASNKPLRELIEGTQYGYTAPATGEPVGPRLVRITDLKDGEIDWNGVPFCECTNIEQYQIRKDDLLFARTGATTGKSHFVTKLPDEPAVFASYLIRVRPMPDLTPEYLASFFLSDHYWQQIVEQKEGSAQANVNGEKLSRLQVPIVEPIIQRSITSFMEAVRQRNQGFPIELPCLPPPLDEQRRLVERIDILAAKVGEAKRLREEAYRELVVLAEQVATKLNDWSNWPTLTMEKLVGRANLKNGKSLKTSLLPSEVHCLTLSSMRCGSIDTCECKPVPMSMADARPFLVRQGDVFVVRGNGSKHLVGRAGYVKTVDRSVIYPDLFIKIPLHEKTVLPRYFVTIWNSRELRSQIEDLAKTTSGIWKINQSHIASIAIPIPSIAEQTDIVKRADEMEMRYQSVKSVQTMTSLKLDALLPAILDRAFRGEL